LEIEIIGFLFVLFIAAVAWILDRVSGDGDKFISAIATFINIVFWGGIVIFIIWAIFN